MLSRRSFLRGSTPALGAIALGKRALAAKPRLPRVSVSPDRVIRTIAGLRPFRPAGFCVRAEKLAGKLIIHNYGHGGAGITLSWGTGLLAVREAAGVETRDCAVLGCGVNGLTTARLLQQRGYNPVIYSKEMPPSVTSNVAGGLWEPVSLFDHASVTPAFRAQFAEAARLSFQRYQSLAGDYYGVRWLPLYTLAQDAAAIAPPAPDSPNGPVESLYPESHDLGGHQHPFNVPFVHRRDSMLIEPAIYLNALIRDFELAGGRIVIREFGSPREVAALRETLIFNCTGLGARTLFADTSMLPIKGQLVFLLPQPEVDYMTIGPNGIYMFPRHDGILLGGSFERGVENTDIDPAVTQRILRDNGALFGGMRG
ncbi:MAG TPA: FAD-dependent oxidoreductase [Bryobacteraceae bacterium]|nr:FAD-dependent oxidoreductase [Bryobacteraceae bacterium]